MSTILLTQNKNKTRLWTADQDRILKSLVDNSEQVNWLKISENFGEIFGVKRSAKQCRDRWSNHLVHDFNTSEWSEEEMTKLFKFQKIYQTSWNLIARELCNRSEAQAKNKFYSTIRRNIRLFNKGKVGEERIKFKSLSILSCKEIRKILTHKKVTNRCIFLHTFLSETAVHAIRQQFSEVYLPKTPSNEDLLPEMTFTYEEFNFSNQ